MSAAKPFSAAEIADLRAALDAADGLALYQFRERIDDERLITCLLMTIDAEREACARICDRAAHLERADAAALAVAIRARGEP